MNYFTIQSINLFLIQILHSKPIFVMKTDVQIMSRIIRQFLDLQIATHSNVFLTFYHVKLFASAFNSTFHGIFQLHTSSFWGKSGLIFKRYLWIVPRWISRVFAFGIGLVALDSSLKSIVSFEAIQFEKQSLKNRFCRKWWRQRAILIYQSIRSPVIPFFWMKKLLMKWHGKT